MGKLHKTAQKWTLGNKAIKAVAGEDFYDSIHPLGTQSEAAYDATKAAEQALKDAQDPVKNPVIPVADEAELARQRRRRNASRRGSTSSNIYTSDERLGG